MPADDSYWNNIHSVSVGIFFTHQCKGDGEVVPASNGADVQPAEEATHPRESSPGRPRSESTNHSY